MQRCNHEEIFGATSAMVGQILPPPPPSWNRVKESGNLGATYSIDKDSNADLTVGN